MLGSGGGRYVARLGDDEVEVEVEGGVKELMRNRREGRGEGKESKGRRVEDVKT